jgi:S1-C subfamily serine protease
MTFRRALTIGVTAAALSFAARAADPVPVEMPKQPTPGAPIAKPLPPIGDISNAGKSIGGLPADRITKAIEAARASAEAPLRGKAEQDLYEKFSGSVVLIVAPKSLGSGTLIADDGVILTAWHVVAGQKSVGVIFKPSSEDTRVYPSDAVEAKVLRVDEVADLALVKITAVPPGMRAVALADPTTVKVGADVHAIGHPMGEVWSYTKGIVSQIRANFGWTIADDGVDHRADVVQTQTPISPGNSGGPLLNEAGEIIGVASFGGEQGTQINYGIASGEVRRFMKATSDRLARRARATASAAAVPAKTKACKPELMSSTRSTEHDTAVFAIDTDCDGKRDALLAVPDDTTQPVMLGVDSNKNGRDDVVYVDKDGDMKFDYVVYDTDEDGKADLIGYDIDENLEPHRVVTPKK